MLAPAPGTPVIDVGCGTGYFTRRFAHDGHSVTGLDSDPAAIDFARAHSGTGERYVRGDARALPFADREFDCCVSVTALCFIAEESVALAEMFRVTRRRLVLGLLNRRSILHLQKGRAGGAGAYREAHWHTAREVRELFARMPCQGPRVEYAVFLPSGRLLARCAELMLPKRLPFGAFLAVCADVRPTLRPSTSASTGISSSPRSPRRSR